jgi:hypothetical protein
VGAAQPDPAVPVRAQRQFAVLDAIELVIPELRSFVDHNARRERAAVALLVQAQAAGHDRAHVGSGQVRVTAGLVRIVERVTSLVGDELHAAPICIEDLRAAGDEPGIARVAT